MLPVTARRVAVIQSNYIPWKGYFDIIRACDEFILYDDAQFTSRDWRNRNCLKTEAGLRWLTVPVAVKGRRTSPIKDIRIADASWRKKHWHTIERTYARTEHFKDMRGFMQDLYLKEDFNYLSDLNRHFIAEICAQLGIRTRVTQSMDYALDPRMSSTEKLVELCKKTGAEEYISGPTARSYLDRTVFDSAGIRVRFADYSGYPEYRQLHPPFIHEVSVIDLLVNEGPSAPRFLKTI